MKTVFECSGYRNFLTEIICLRKERGKTNAELARVMGCQAAYLSQVIKEKADLTEEHIMRLAAYLELNDLETEYFLLLLRLGKAGSQELRQYLARRSQALKEQADELAPRLDSEKKPALTNEFETYYVSSWIPSLIHVATSCENLQTIETIAERFHFDESVVEFHLRKLERVGLVALKNERWAYSGGSIHFSKDSALDHQFQISRRLMAMSKLFFRAESDVRYTVAFATDITTAQQVRSQIIDLIESVHKTVAPSPSEDVYLLNLDFLRA